MDYCVDIMLENDRNSLDTSKEIEFRVRQNTKSSLCNTKVNTKSNTLVKHKKKVINTYNVVFLDDYRNKRKRG